MLKFKRKFGIFLFSALVFAIGFSPIASAHYDGDHIDIIESGNYFLIELIPTPEVGNVLMYTTSSGVKYYMNVTYEEGVNGTTILKQLYAGNANNTGHTMQNQRYWTVPVNLPYIGGVITSEQFNYYVSQTGFLGLTMSINAATGQVDGYSDVLPDTVTWTNGAPFVLVQTVGDTNYYTWVYSSTDGTIPNIVTELLAGDTPSVDGNVPFYIPFTNTGPIKAQNTWVSELGIFKIYNNSAGAIIPDADSTTIIIESIDNLGVAIDTAISAGVDEINSVVLQQTDEITGAVESQTEAILNYRSDVDMSISQNAEVATKLAEESLINQQIYDGYVTPEYDMNVGDTIDQNFGDGVGFLSDAMQMIFDFGVGNLILVLLTIGTSLFIIGRSMR